MQKELGFWIIPEGDFYEEAEGIIRAHHEQYGSPIFTPHMTIHSHFPNDEQAMLQSVREAAQEVVPFEAEIESVDVGESYFRCVYARVAATAEVTSAHLALRDLLNFTQPQDFLPHVSLIYGDFDQKTREKIAQDIVLRNRKFSASKFTVIASGGSKDPNDWEILEQIAFTG